jgi:DNA-binding IclR family transcriptional regulator
MAEKGAAAVDRALSIVSALGDARRALTLSETAAATRLYKSTALRLLASLVRAGFVAQDADGRYRLGSSIYRLAIAYEHSAALADEVRPALQRIVDETGESAGFFTREGNERLCIVRVDSPNPLRHHIEVGVPRPLHLGAAGRVLTLFDKGAGGAKPRDFATLPLAVLGTDVPDLAAIAVPLFGLSGKTLGAVSVSGPVSRFDRSSVVRIKRLLQDVASTLTDRLGGDSDVFRWRGRSQTKKSPAQSKERSN